MKSMPGQSGARSTRSDPHDEASSVMYIAAPVMDKGRIIGVLSVGKPNLAMTPVIKHSEPTIMCVCAWIVR
ncbi:two-component system sensor histidine kinase CreC, partial [Pseudomonas aeruginosa]